MLTFHTVACGQSKDDFAIAKTDAAAGKTANAMKVCVSAQLKSAKVSFVNATATRKVAAVRACERKATQNFRKAGGRGEDFDVAKLDGALARAADTVKVCVSGALKKAKVKRFEHAARVCTKRRTQRESVGGRSRACVFLVQRARPLRRHRHRTVQSYHCPRLVTLLHTSFIPR